jgi:hypothetical protein
MGSSLLSHSSAEDKGKRHDSSKGVDGREGLLIVEGRSGESEGTVPVLPRIVFVFGELPGVDGSLS